MATFQARVSLTPSEEVVDFTVQEVVDAINESLKTTIVMLQNVALETAEEERYLALWRAIKIENM